ncbi:MAG: M23 family metallopeptidase [Candidatus Paceibacterota bacterium]|jgi:murein DD-endopeptidase MepM/ murein hydrolase activator NlpD
MQPNNLQKILNSLMAFLQGLRAKPFVINKPVLSKNPEAKETQMIVDVPIEIRQETVLQPIKTSFLICPIRGNHTDGKPLTSRTVRISAVVDHSGTAIDPESTKFWGKPAKDQRVKAFNGEVGFGKQCPVEPCGYQKENQSEFFANKEINYVGVGSDGGKCTLQYDGHAGYDFPYSPGTPIIAPADGELHRAIQGSDLIYGACWEKDHSIYIKHDNGFVTWFRHSTKLTDELETLIVNSQDKSCRVEKGQLIAQSGNFEMWKTGGTAAHVHFEVRNPDGKIVDPYGDKLWED